MMKCYTPEELAEVLRLHALWKNDAEGGSRADLRRADLSGANLIGADLRDANLIGADLRGADLSGAELRDANLIGADLSGAELRDANLIGADLRRADLSGANLSGAELRDANLIGADLRRADLSGANLSGANLSWAELRDANLIGANLCGANGINIIQVGPIGSRRATTTYWIDEDRVACGCWRDYQGGSLEDFAVRVHQEHANNPRFLAEYNAAIAQFRVAREYAAALKPSKQEEV
jgi:hypothetical protein